MDLIGAGSETVRTSTLFCLYAMAAYPDVQRRVVGEILDIVGQERLPDFQDQKYMPYTHSVILEIMRWKTVVAVNIPHCTTNDTTIGGYEIPKGTTIIANFWNLHHDARYWSEPDSFKPERFLSENGKTVVKNSHYAPFSLGKRVCPGEAMANIEIFLYFTSILQKFEIVFPDGYEPTFEAELGLTYRLKPFLARFIPRTDSSAASQDSEIGNK